MKLSSSEKTKLPYNLRRTKEDDAELMHIKNKQSELKNALNQLILSKQHSTKEEERINKMQENEVIK